MKYSKYQEDIFETVLGTNKNIAVSATAGSGKTTTIVEAAKLLSQKYPYKKILFNAFNKSIVDELKKRLPEKINCSTIHSLGMKSLISHYKTNLKVDEYKSFIFSERVVKDIEKLEKKEKLIYRFTLSDIVQLLRMTMCEVNEESIEILCTRFDIDVLNNEINHSINLYNDLVVYNKSLSKFNNMIDFTDMIYLPAFNDEIKLPQYDVVFLDEVQDLNFAQHFFIKKVIKPGGRIIAVGDKRQSIYGFSGADINSFEYFEKQENTVTLPLSVCYRCAKSIVNNAKKIYNDIQFFEGQNEGIVRRGDFNEITKNDFVISRNTRPLVSAYFNLIENDKKSYIKGRDIEKGLMKLYLKVKNLDKFEAFEKLDFELNKLYNELVERNIRKPTENNKFLNLQEKIKIIKLIANKCKYMFEVESKIKDLFTDKVDAITLSTIHKAKGLEADRVFFIERYNNEQLIPSRYALQDWELVQENNLLFVALTRSKSELIYIDLKD